MDRTPVVLLHGLARSRRSMRRLAKRLERSGFETVCLGYPSTRYAIEDLATQLRPRIRERFQNAKRIHFVTHSMGGIVMRQIQASDPLPNIGRVVMLAPPNQGSEIVDAVGSWPLFRWWNGPAGQQLGTHREGFIQKLPKPQFELGVIAGDRRGDPVLSRLFPGPNDGKVSVERTRIDGMKDWRCLHVGHTFIMNKREVYELVKRFLRSGAF